MRTSYVLAGLAATASLAVAGCGATVIDTGKVEKSIGQTVTAQAGVRVKSVSCPGDPKAKKGATFTCSVTGKDGTKGNVLVTQQDDKGNVHLSAPFLHIRADEAAIAEQIKKQTKAVVTVTCPEIVVPKTGATFPCSATDGTQTRKIESTMTDDKGNFRFKLL